MHNGFTNLASFSSGVFRSLLSLFCSLLLLSLSYIASSPGTFSDIARGATCRNGGHDSELSGFFIDFPGFFRRFLVT